MNTKKCIAVLGLAVVCLAALAVVQMPTVMSLNKAPQADSKKVKESPTLIQEGVVTEKQKHHRKLFHHNGPKLHELANRKSGDVEVVEGVGMRIKVPESGPKLSALQSAVCNADAIVVGTLNSKSSQLTEDENFVFTDLEITVQEVLKSGTVAPLTANESIIVTRGGGAIELNGRVFRARTEGLKPMSVGNQYLLFLRYIPETNSYLAYGNGSFQFEANRLLPLAEAAEREIFKGETKDATTFLNEVRTALSHSCEAR